jgi:hypothetical protein
MRCTDVAPNPIKTDSWRVFAMLYTVLIRLDGISGAQHPTTLRPSITSREPTVRIRRSLDLRHVRKTKRSPADIQRRRAFFAAYNVAYEAMPADPGAWTRERAELERTLMVGMAPSRPTKFSPAEIERRRAFFAEYNAAYEAMQADPELWARELAERAELDGTQMDGLDQLSPAEIELRRAFFAECDAAYAAMEANPALWEEEMRERRLWEATLLDGLEED